MVIGLAKVGKSYMYLYHIYICKLKMLYHWPEDEAEGLIGVNLFVESHRWGVLILVVVCCLGHNLLWEWNVHGSASIRSWTTSFMVGRRAGFLYVHRIAILRTWIISSLNELDTLLSRTSMAPSFVSTLFDTQYMMFLFSPNSASTGFFPVISSISTIPKLYTSHFVVAFDEYAYSALFRHTTKISYMLFKKRKCLNFESFNVHAWCFVILNHTTLLHTN